jgi:uncharacterized protein YprB with RNaseH-like and TPR domain
MIESTFCFLPGIGGITERRLWRNGLLTWSDFLSASTVRGISPARKALYDEGLSQAQAHHARDDARYFGTLLRQREHWRLYEWLRPRAVYLDIETDSFGQISVVGLYGRGQFTSLVQGESLSRRRVCDELSQYDLLVTFCGTTFDLPMLIRHYEGLPLDQPHIDLCFLGRQLGYRGGLKAVEVEMGITRASELQGLNGNDAVLLWNRWRFSRDEEARVLLLGYNEADCVNLESLAHTFFSRMVETSLALEQRPRYFLDPLRK